MAVKAPEKRTLKARSGIKTAFARIAAASAIIVAVCLLHFLPQAAAVRRAVRRVFCYDYFGRTDIGTSVLESE